MASEFGFTVREHNDLWSVYLPHQCDEWHITEYYKDIPRETAIEDLSAFIAEAQVALAALRRGEEYGTEK